MGCFLNGVGKCGGKSFEVRHSGSHTFGRQQVSLIYVQPDYDLNFQKNVDTAV